MLLRLIIPEGPTIFHPSRINILRSQKFAMPRSLALEFKYQGLVFPMNSKDLMGRAGFSSSNLQLFSLVFYLHILHPTFDFSVVSKFTTGRTWELSAQSRNPG